MDETFLHKDGPFAIPDFQLKSIPGEDDGPPALTPLPSLPHTQTDWPGDLAFLEREDFLEEHTGSPWPETASVSRIESPRAVSVTSDHEDVWDLPLREIENVEPKPKRTWEHVADPAFRDPCKYLSETGPRAFDLALRLCVPEERTIRSVEPDIFLNSLLQLGLGRESLLFVAQDDGQFAWRIDEARITGLSSPVTQSVVKAFMECGYYFRRLRKMAASVYRKKGPPPAVIAFAQLIGDLLTELEALVTEKLPARSVLQLQDAFKLPFKTLTLLDDIFKALWRFDNDQDALSCIFEIAQEVEKSEIGLIDLMQEVLKHVSRPWLEAVDACIGLRKPMPGSIKLRSLLESSMDWGASLNDENMFDEAFPKFFSLADRQLVLQIFQGMKVLADQASPLRPSLSVDKYDGLRWAFTWKDITAARVTSMSADQHEDPPITSNVGEDFVDTNTIEPYANPVAMLQESYGLIEGTRSDQGTMNVTWKIVLRHVFDTKHVQTKILSEPNLEISAFSSFRSQLSLRAKAINRMCLEVLFDTSNSTRKSGNTSLIYHLNILHRYLLMHHGMFTTRLCHALFDPSLSSTERDEGHVRSGQMGLRLGSRTNWPPASSELQLALAGILGTSFLEDDPSWSKSRLTDLPGGLSFALRTLSDEEINRCLDPNSLEALDFLKIRYTPPQPLDIVILPEVLEKYDQMLKLLLRLQRLLFIANHSFHPPRASASAHPAFNGATALRYAHAARHFVTTFSDYIMTSAIAQPWAKFMAEIHALEASVRDPPSDDPSSGSGSGSGSNNTQADTTGRPASGHSTHPSRPVPRRRQVTEQHNIQHIRQLHAAALDAMLTRSLLRQRHDKVRDVLDGALRLVLRFAALRQELARRQEEAEAERRSGSGAGGGAGVYTDDRTNSEATVADLYARFRKQVALLVQVCRGLAARQGAEEGGGSGGGGGGGGEEGGFGALVARLTINDFYVDRPAR